MPSGLVSVARVTDIPERKSKLVRIGDDDIALWRVDGKIFAISNVCAHQHFSALHQGTLEGLAVRCPMHGWTYSLETGKAQSGDGRVKTYRVEIRGGEVFLEGPPPDP